MDSLNQRLSSAGKVLSFYNMVQVHKNLHRQYLEARDKDKTRILQNYIPFYIEIELITLTKESIFHQLREFKANAYYYKLWLEISERMGWQSLTNPKGLIVDMPKEEPVITAQIPITTQPGYKQKEG